MTEIENSPRLRFLDDNGEAYPEWEMRTLGEVAEIIGGGTPKSEVNEYWDGNINWLTPSEINTKYILKSKRKITDKGLKYSSAKLLPIGTVVFTSRATIGLTSILKVPSSTNQGFQNFIPKKNLITSEFLFYVIFCLKNFCKLNASGSTFKEISKSKISKATIPVPSLAEQEKIAGFLSALDENVKANEKLLELLKVEKTGYLQKIFNRELRFMDDNGEAYPEWEMKTLGDIMEKRSSSLSLSTLKTSGKYPIYAANGITKYFSDKYIDREYITIIKDGAGVGRLSKAPQNSYFIGTLQGLVSKDNTTNDFLYHILSSIDLSQSVGSTIPHIYFKDYAKKSILLPSLPEQEKIASFLSALDDRIDAQTELIKTLKEEKKAYLQRIFG